MERRGRQNGRSYGSRRSQNQNHSQKKDRRNSNPRRAEKPRKPAFDRRSVRGVTQEQIIAAEAAIHEFKSHQVPCALCGQPIADVSSAIADRDSGAPAHFDCVLGRLQESERVSEPEKLVYIGKGRFGVVSFPNPRDTRNFLIRRIIEWEARDSKFEWRSDMARLYSQVQ